MKTGQDEILCDGWNAREYAAIHLRVPNSGTEWLDDMIRESLRDELAKAAMQSIMLAPVEQVQLNSIRQNETVGEHVSSNAYAMARAMLRARESGNG